jgi:hypothetical protein
MLAYQSERQELSTEERERLIIEHMPQVNLIARRIHETLPGNVCLDDLVSSGVVGLIMAIDNYDPTQAVKLKTYAEYKIRAPFSIACAGWIGHRGTGERNIKRSSTPSPWLNRSTTGRLRRKKSPSSST